MSFPDDLPPPLAMPTTGTCLLSIVVPCYNEEAVLPIFHARLQAALAPLAGDWEVIYVNDGSSDGTLGLLAALKLSDPAVGFASLSRNFGKEAAMSAGLRLAGGRAVVMIDADLQDPPELIPEMVRAWQQGADVINMRRRSRQGETWFKKASAHAFYRVINWMSETPIPEDVGDFRLLSRRSVEALNLLPERNRFMKGLFAWIGFAQVTIAYDRHARAAGETKWPYFKLFHFAVEGITGFSVIPLRLASYAGFLSAAGAFIYALAFVVKTMVIGDTVRGFPTLIVTILLLGGLQLMAMGILGEYLGRLFMESKRRPLYLLDQYHPPASTPGPSSLAAAAPLARAEQSAPAEFALR
jgi:polyisoprenyl-phosphate glycosyltransferase